MQLRHQDGAVPSREVPVETQQGEGSYESEVFRPARLAQDGNWWPGHRRECGGRGRTQLYRVRTADYQLCVNELLTSLARSSKPETPCQGG